MLKPKQTPYYPFTVTIPNPYETKSPHKITPKVFRGCMNNCSEFDCNTQDAKRGSKQDNCGKIKGIHKQLKLDNCLFDNSTPQKNPPLASFIQPSNKSTQKIPTNPFQQILHESDTPDFNLSLPFVDDFSKIDLKSPTFSDIFTMSEIKSPQFRNQNHNYFMTARKKPNEVKEDFNRTVKIGESYVRDARDGNFLQKMDRFIEEMSIQRLQVINKPNKTKCKTTCQETVIKSSTGYKLKNHFNPSTPKLTKPKESFSRMMNTTLQKSQNQQSYISAQIIPQQQGKIPNPIAINYPKSPKVYKFGDGIKSNRDKNYSRLQQKQNVRPTKEQIKQLIVYKMAIPKLELKAEMEEIYNGKFKIQKSARY